ncbi:MAG: KH domain-containing protein [Candidatus Micrarchaeia archaeon]
MGKLNTPFCEACIASGTLCVSCQSKVDEGSLSRTDVKVAEFLHDKKKSLGLENVEFEKSFETSRVVVLLTCSEPGLLIGKGGKVASALTKHLQKHVKVVGTHVDANTALSQVLTPLRTRGMNTVYREGEKSFKIRLSKHDAKRLPLKKEFIEKVLSQVFKTKVFLEFE